MRVILIMTLKYAFYRFYRDFKKFKRMASLDSKHGKLKEFNKLLSDFKDLKPHTDERKKRKIEVMNNFDPLYNKII